MEDQTAVQPSTVHGWLDHWARARPDSTFVRLGDSQFTFARLAEESRLCASALSRHGIESGDRIALAVDNGVEWLTAFFAAMRLGAVIVTVNPVYRTEELNHILGVTEAKIVISHQRSGDFDVVEYYSGADLPSLETTVFLPDPESDGAGLLLFEDLLREGRHDDPDIVGGVDASAEYTALILFSSGTTGRSKGAVLTHETLIASATAQAEEFGQTERDVILGVMPLTHVGGITCTVISSLVKGGGIDMVPRFHPRVVVDLLLANRVTIMVGVPTMYAMLLSDPRLSEADLSGLRICVIGGANVEPATARLMAEIFSSARLANLYGLSESSGACIISSATATMEDLSASIGAPIGDVDVRIDDGAGGAAPAGTEGELQVAGRCVMKGYWRLPEETAAAKTEDGWLNTGDIAVLDPAGTVTLRGRSKEMYTYGGYNVYPAEAENVISALPGVDMVAVIGVPDATYGNSGRAFVVQAAGASIKENEILEYCATRLAEYKVPSSVTFVDALPLTPSGKIQKAKLRD